MANQCLMLLTTKTCNAASPVNRCHMVRKSSTLQTRSKPRIADSQQTDDKHLACITDCINDIKDEQQNSHNSPGPAQVK